MTEVNPLFIIGAVLLLASIVVFLMRKENATFPIILAVGGIFLVAAEQVSASLPGGVSIEFRRAVGEAAEKNGQFIAKQETALKAVSQQVDTLQGSFLAYQSAVNDRFNALQAAPVPVPDKAELEASNKAVQDQLKAINRSKVEVLQANNNLSRYLQRAN